MKAAAALALGCCLVAGSASAQQPVTVNATVVPRSGQGDLQQTFSAILREQDDAAWVGYTVPAARGGASASGNDDWSERCRLEPSTSGVTGRAGPTGPVKLEPSPSVMVLFRLQSHQVQKIRTYPGDCQIDAGGLALVWLDAVVPAQSVALLRGFASEPALGAIALHRDPAATATLLEMATSGVARLRERALFWIARRAESKAASTISAAIENDPEVEVKKQAVFALTQLPAGEGVPLLITLARTAANPVVRKQAYFWLGQSKDPRALSFFEEVLR